MNSDYNHNPLTEVALALSMAFFALMVLSIFALTQKEQEKSSKCHQAELSSSIRLDFRAKRVKTFMSINGRKYATNNGKLL